MEYENEVSNSKPEIEFDHEYARSFMSERYQIYTDAIDSLIVDRALTRFFGDLAKRLEPLNPILDKEEKIRTLLLEE